MALAVPRGPTGLRLTTEFQERNNDAGVDELVAAVRELVNAIPAGVVCFFPSFAYLQRFVDRAKASRQWDALSAAKQVFLEPRAATAVEGTLREYERAIVGGSSSDGTATTAPTSTPAATRGALLLCVVGGKLSEGINFGDHLGRCVAVGRSRRARAAPAS